MSGVTSNPLSDILEAAFAIGKGIGLGDGDEVVIHFDGASVPTIAWMDASGCAMLRAIGPAVPPDLAASGPLGFDWSRLKRGMARCGGKGFEAALDDKEGLLRVRLRNGAKRNDVALVDASNAAAPKSPRIGDATTFTIVTGELVDYAKAACALDAKTTVAGGVSFTLAAKPDSGIYASATDDIDRVALELPGVAVEGPAAACIYGSTFVASAIGPAPNDGVLDVSFAKDDPVRFAYDLAKPVGWRVEAFVAPRIEGA